MMKFIDRGHALSNSEAYSSHGEATAHGMCEDNERLTIDRGVWAEDTGQLDDKIQEALQILSEAAALSKQQETNAYSASFKVDVAWNCGESGEPVLAVSHEGYAYRVDLRSIPFHNLSAIRLDRLADTLTGMAEACRIQASNKGAD